MASMKMCKPAPQPGHCGATNQAMAAGQGQGQGRPCAPEKKQHFWHRQQQQQHSNEQGHGHKLTQCFGAYGAKPAHHGGHGGAYHETDEIEVVRVEERVSIVHHKSKSRAANKCTEHYKYSDSSDSESDNGRRKKC